MLIQLAMHPSLHFVDFFSFACWKLLRISQILCDFEKSSSGLYHSPPSIQEFLFLLY